MRLRFAIVSVLALPTQMIACKDDTSIATDDDTTTSTTTQNPDTSTTDDTETGAPSDMPVPPVGCTVDPSAEAQLRPGIQDDGSTILVNGRLTHSYGEGVLLHGLGADVTLHPSVDVA